MKIVTVTMVVIAEFDDDAEILNVLELQQRINREGLNYPPEDGRKVVVTNMKITDEKD